MQHQKQESDSSGFLLHTCSYCSAECVLGLRTTPAKFAGSERTRRHKWDALTEVYVVLTVPLFPVPLGLLAVFDAYDTSDKETKQGETPGAASDLNRLEKDLIYVGGLPHSKAVRYDVKPWDGCVEFPGLCDPA